MTGTEVHSISQILTLWQLMLLNDEQVNEWAWERVAASEFPAQELFDLALDGPEKCLRRAEFEFTPRPAQLPFTEEFALKALATTTESDESVLAFARWTSSRAMGEELENPFVRLSYRVDHLLEDCQDPTAAVELVRHELPQLRPLCESIAAPFLQGMPQWARTPPLERAVVPAPVTSAPD